MQEKYINHFLLMATTKFLERISDNLGDVPFRAAVQNYMYYPDTYADGKLRIQSFVENLYELVKKLEKEPDPDPPPKLVEIAKEPVFTPTDINVESGVSIESLLGEGS